MILGMFTEVLDYFVDSNSTGFSSAPFKFNRFITRFYNIDSSIEFFKRNGNSRYIR